MGAKVKKEKIRVQVAIDKSTYIKAKKKMIEENETWQSLLAIFVDQYVKESR